MGELEQLPEEDVLEGRKTGTCRNRGVAGVFHPLATGVADGRRSSADRCARRGSHFKEPQCGLLPVNPQLDRVGDGVGTVPPQQTHRVREEEKVSQNELAQSPAAQITVGALLLDHRGQY